MDLIPPTPRPEPARVEALAASLLAHPNSEMQRRIENHRMLYHMFWDDPDLTPRQIAVAMGTRAILFLQFAGANITQFTALAESAGKKLEDAIPDSDWMPRLPLIPNPDGTVTVDTVAELDDWGRPLPIEESIPENLDPLTL